MNALLNPEAVKRLTADEEQQLATLEGQRRMAAAEFYRLRELAALARQKCNAQKKRRALIDSAWLGLMEKKYGKS